MICAMSEVTGQTDDFFSQSMIASADDLRLVAGLRDGDEAVFAALLEQYHNPMIRLAAMYVNDRAVAEEVVQETWVAVLQGISRFEGRSSLKTWLFRILTNRAKTRAQREGRYVPLTLSDDADTDEPAVSAERFHPAGDEWPGDWLVEPAPWDTIPETRLLSLETRATIQRAIDMLPPNQREVITLRDIQGFGSEEVCNVLNISESNQRVLLHRARSKVRQALESYLAE
jgi:RNA polymerase sigma-70 factor, ECF subfamily